MYLIHACICNVWTLYTHVCKDNKPVHSCIQIICSMYVHRYPIHRHVCTCYIHVQRTYVPCMYNAYVIFVYLYSTACLYNKSSEGVNLFCCSSSILGRKPPSKASVCDMLLPFVATGTGSLHSNECSLSKPSCSWLSKPHINLLMASSVSAASGLA